MPGFHTTCLPWFCATLYIPSLRTNHFSQLSLLLRLSYLSSLLHLPQPDIGFYGAFSSAATGATSKLGSLRSLAYRRGTEVGIGGGMGRMQRPPPYGAAGAATISKSRSFANLSGKRDRCDRRACCPPSLRLLGFCRDGTCLALYSQIRVNCLSGNLPTFDFYRV